MRMKSKVDWWLGATMWTTIAVVLVILWIVPEEERLLGYAIGLPMIALIIWIYFGTYYELREEYLYCRSGPFFERIAYDKIKSVRLCQNLWSSLALSAKRIEIRQHGKGFLLGTTYISPENRELFFRELVKRCKNLEKT